MPSLKGAIAPMTWNILFFFMSSLLPFLINRKQGLKYGVFALFAVTLTLVITNLTVLFLFGGITGNFVYPFMSAARYISYADFFENLEALVMAIWIGAMFIKIGLFHYVLTLSTAQWLNLSNYKPLAIPFGLLLTLYGNWSNPNLQEQAHHVATTIPFLHIIFFILIPVSLLFLASFRK